MPDTDKVVKALECQKEYSPCGHPCEYSGACNYARWQTDGGGIAYLPYVCDSRQIYADALALIRELKSKADAYDQVKWERDIAVGQLEQIGKSLGEKMDDVKQEWISVNDKMPESGKYVLATCEIRSLSGYKKRYVCEAYYAKEHSISAGGFPDDDDCYDYSEEDDEYFLKEGWYEVIHNWDEYGSVVIGDFVTHWMPLPEAPKEDKNGTD